MDVETCARLKEVSLPLQTDQRMVAAGGLPSTLQTKEAGILTDFVQALWEGKSITDTNTTRLRQKSFQVQSENKSICSILQSQMSWEQQVVKT